MQLAAANSPPLRLESHGAAVGLLQGGLIQTGFRLPKSTRKGKPDRRYGAETYAAVRAFQTRHHLGLDGVAGKTTILRLDALLAATAGVPQQLSPVVVPPIMSRDYQLGTGDPPRRHDPGAGPWHSTPTEPSYVALKLAILDVLPTAAVTIGVNAALHMGHYLGNSGSPYTIDLEAMVASVSSAQKRYLDEVVQARSFVEQLPAGRADITSRTLDQAYNAPAQSTNWYFAIGGYSTWGKGTATVQDDAQGRNYVLDFEYKFYDRYNWDRGKSVTIGGIVVTDAFMGEFHRQGLAQEFDCFSSIKRRFTWKKGEAISAGQLASAGGR